MCAFLWWALSDNLLSSSAILPAHLLNAHPWPVIPFDGFIQGPIKPSNSHYKNEAPQFQLAKNVSRRPFTILPFQVNLRFVLLSTKRKTRSNSPKTQSDNFYVWLSENIALLGHDLLPVILYRMTTAHTAIYVMFKIMFKIISESWKIPPLLDRRGDRINYPLPKIVVSFHPLVVNPGHKKAC